MTTVTVPRANVSQEELVAVLRDQLGSKIAIETQGSDTVKVKQSIFSHAKVRAQPGGSGTTFAITPFAVGPLGWVITTFGLSKKIAQAIGEASQLR